MKRLAQGFLAVLLVADALGLTVTGYVIGWVVGAAR